MSIWELSLRAPNLSHHCLSASIDPSHVKWKFQYSSPNILQCLIWKLCQEIFNVNWIVDHHYIFMLILLCSLLSFPAEQCPECVTMNFTLVKNHFKAKMSCFIMPKFFSRNCHRTNFKKIIPSMELLRSFLHDVAERKCYRNNVK